MLNKLTKKDFEQIDFWRLRYGVGGEYDNAISRPFALAEKWLTKWAEKKKALYNLFGENLIISKEVNLKVPNAAIVQKMSEYFDSQYWTYDPFVSFIKQFRNKVSFYKLSYDFKRLVAFDALAANRCNFLDHDQVYVYNFDDVQHKITIHKNEKIMKVIKRIANLMGMDMELYEQFRIIQSRFTNNTSLQGKLCLSIHPLDYMTMSDNECGWHSCMSWRHTGCYRRGTIEMMTAPNVVVAYLESADGHLTEIDWNSKKWRELFVVSEKVIAGIKAYPYPHNELELMIIDWLKSLYTTEFTPVYHLYNNERLEEEHDFSLTFETGWMYNDFGCTDSALNPICFNIDYYNAILADGPDSWHSYYYGGPAICVWCGECNDYEDQDDEASNLICEECMAAVRFCDICGRPLGHGETLHELNHSYYCEACYKDRVMVCPITYEEYDGLSQYIHIYLYPSNHETPLNYISTRYDARYSANWSLYVKASPYRTRLPGGFGTYWAVNEEDLTERGRELFNLTH